ncbi:MAG: hypothetical protein CL525_07725 [Aequorivita sp.]|nr:hypothetical protein [Aequorivita sp.]|tara:strand:+ start:633 stop:845 length:213 start_codon:yes stop_codon:yes gene_type:complete
MKTDIELLLEELRIEVALLCHKENTTDDDIKKIHELSTFRTKLIEAEIIKRHQNAEDRRKREEFLNFFKR